MTSETMRKFDEFVHRMWAANCSERDAFGDTVLRKKEYVTEYEEYLLDQFWLEWGNNRKWIKGEWKREE